ncbi:MAG: 2TM domain-containing protein [Promethearchaeota archaeon]
MITENTEHIKLHKWQKRLTGLKIHWLIFIIVNLILFLINYFTDYSNMWHFYPLMGWAVVVLIHTAVVFIINFLDNAKQASLAIHASITMITASYLVWNDWWDNNRLNWILFAVVPLVLIWLNHYGLYRILRKSDLSGKSRFDYMVEKELQKLGRAGEQLSQDDVKKVVMNRVLLQNHILIYAAVNLFLFLINLYTGANYLWFLWSTISWGVNILFHAFYYVNLKKRTLGQKITVKYLLAYPFTIGLYLVFVDVFSDGNFNWFWWPVAGLAIVSMIIAKVSSTMQVRKNASPKSKPRTTSKRSKRVSAKPQGEVREQPVRQFCRNCGAQIKPNHQFCESCGHRL